MTPLFVAIKLIKSVVSLRTDFAFGAMGCNNGSTNDDIISFGPSQPEIIGLPTGLGLWILVRV